MTKITPTEKKLFIFIPLFSLIAALLIVFVFDDNSPRRLTELDWADTTSYMCAVGVDGYNGDVLEAGMYAVTPTSVDSGAGKVPIVWDIYVSKNQYSRLSDLKTEEHKLTVGGINGDSGTVVLNNGDYLYIKYNEVAGTPTGILHMEKQ